MIIVGFFFFFKQKTAYEMRISDWSSDVCSSDLACDRHGADAAGYGGQRAGDLAGLGERHVAHEPALGLAIRRRQAVDPDVDHGRARLDPVAPDHLRPPDRRDEDVRAPAERGKVASLRMGDRKSTRLNSSH